MPKRKVNEDNIKWLEFQMDELKKENSKIWLENINLTTKINSYREIVESLINEHEFWSEKAIKSGLIDRLRTLIK